MNIIYSILNNQGGILMGCNFNKDYSYYNKNYYKVENHNHEFLSSTDYEEDDEGVVHNHRIAGVTGPPIKYGKSHVHKIAVFTDTFGDHFHTIFNTIGPAISLPGGKNINLQKGTTERADG